MNYQQTFIKSDEEKFYNLIKDYNEIYFITGYGNVGDFLIYEGTRTLLSKLNISYKEIHISHAKVYKGELALICGGGAWCSVFNHYMPQSLPLIEKNFKNVIVLPSSFQVSEPLVQVGLSKSKALFLCREMESYNQIKDICNCDLMHDFAFHFDYSTYKQNGNGVLNSFRTDSETTIPYAADNNMDISNMDITLHEWLILISMNEIINTDRAHVMIAGAMMGKTINYRPTSYHKVPAIAEFSLKGLPVFDSNNQ